MLTLKSGKTITIKAITNDGEQEMDITTQVASLAPQLVTPSWVDVVANTTAPIVSGFSNVQFRALAKAEPTVIYKDGSYITNPRDLTANQIRLDICQITPTRIADKLEIDEIDLQQENLQDVVPKYLSTWLLQVNKNIEIKAINDLCYASQEFQKKIEAEDSNKTTFTKGAHFEKTSELTSDSAYKALSDLKKVITRVGLPNANSNIDANFKFATGINISDVIVICSHEFMDTICSKQGVFASEKGIEVFQKMGIRNLLGFDVLPISELPDGVHFVAFTTGQMGALGKGDVAVGFRTNVQMDSNWSWHERIDIERTFYQGVIYDQLVFMFGDETVNVVKTNILKAKNKSEVIRQEDTYYEMSAPKSRIAKMSEENQENIEKSLGQKIVDKVNVAKNKVVETITGNKVESNQEQNQNQTNQEENKNQSSK